MLFELAKKYSRPVLILPDTRILALLDTGAEFPVWVGSRNLLLYAYKAIKVKDNVSFRGFGGEACGTLYRIPTFCLGDLIYPNLNVVLLEDSNKPIQMILSATMFSNMTYSINDKDKYLNVLTQPNETNIRHLEIKDSNGRLHILCNQ